MEHQIIVVGIGPGSPDYLPPAAARQIERARFLAGSARALSAYARPEALTRTITGKIEETFAFIEENISAGDVVVMVSGDPGYYSLLCALRKRFASKTLKVIPGISAMQLAFAKLALPWQEARLVSLHGREPRAGELEYRPGAVLGILTDTAHTSKKIAALLMNAGWPPQSAAYVCSRLSYEDEEIIETTIERAAGAEAVSHCVMAVIG